MRAPMKRGWLLAILIGAVLALVAAGLAIRSHALSVSNTTLTSADAVWTDVEIGDFVVSLPGTPVVQERDELAAEGKPNQVVVVSKIVTRNGAELAAMSLTLQGTGCEDLLDRAASDQIEDTTARIKKRGARLLPVEQRELTLQGLPARSIEISSVEANGSTRRFRVLIFGEDCRLLLVLASTTPETAELAERVFSSIRRLNRDQ